MGLQIRSCLKGQSRTIDKNKFVNLVAWVRREAVFTPPKEAKSEE